MREESLRSLTIWFSLVVALDLLQSAGRAEPKLLLSDAAQKRIANDGVPSLFPALEQDWTAFETVEKPGAVFAGRDS